jgi:site-specific recombinase XerD
VGKKSARFYPWGQWYEIKAAKHTKEGENGWLHITVIGKGDKERTIPISSRTSQVIWRYQTTRSETIDKDPLFINRNDLPFDRHSLRRLVTRIGQRAGVRKVHPHRFRHTFAINFFRPVRLN